MTLAVVVVAYNRQRSLERLLASLLAAEYPSELEVPLVISIDYEDSLDRQEVCKLARAFKWTHGPKEVIEHAEHLGLVEHIRLCGALSERHGGVIILEDDLLAAPPFYRFATGALAAYEDDERIAGVCLYALWFNGFTHHDFLPVDDGNDVFFLGLPYTQGLAFTAAQWRRVEPAFRGGEVAPHPDLHPAFSGFDEDEWFPQLARVLVQEGRYFCFPRVSLTTGTGARGTHFHQKVSIFETPVRLRGVHYDFPKLDDSLAVYDSFYELLPGRLRRITPGLPAEPFDVDLNATKPPAALHQALVLTTRPVRNALATFPLDRRPIELNLQEKAPDGGISLARREDVLMDSLAEREAQRRLFAYSWSRYRPSCRRSLGFAVARLWQMFRTRGQSRR